MKQLFYMKKITLNIQIHQKLMLYLALFIPHFDELKSESHKNRSMNFLKNLYSNSYHYGQHRYQARFLEFYFDFI